MPIPKLNANISSSNYTSFDGYNENLTMLGASVNKGKFNISLGIGNDWTVNKEKSVNKPAFEAKCKFNIGNSLNAQVRFREIGNTEQYRVTFGGSHSFDKQNSIYASAHVTTKNNHENWKTTTGGWIGYTHKFENGISVSTELQQNIVLNKSDDIGKTLGALDGNKSVNVIISLPLD